MKQILSILLVFSLTTLNAFEGNLYAEYVSSTVEVQKKKMLRGKLSLNVPVTFHKMDKKMIPVKYPFGNPPDEVYTNEKTNVNIGVVHKEQQFENKSLTELMTSMESVLSFSIDDFDFEKKEIKEINGQEYAMMKMVTPAVDMDIQNYMLATSYKGRLLVITFNYPVALASNWDEVAEQVLHSIELKN